MSNIEKYRQSLDGQYEEVKHLDGVAERVCLNTLSCATCEISQYLKKDRPELSVGKRVELIRTVWAICCPEEPKTLRRSIIIRG